MSGLTMMKLLSPGGADAWAAGARAAHDAITGEVSGVGTVASENQFYLGA